MPLRKKTKADRIASAEPPDESALAMRGISLERVYEDLPLLTGDITWSADGGFLTAGTRDGVAVIWPAVPGEEKLIAAHPKRVATHAKSPVSGLDWHPENPVLAIGSENGQVFLWNMDTKISQQLCNLHTNVSGLAWSPDGSVLAVSTSSRRFGDGSVGIWDTQRRTLLRDGRLRFQVLGLCWPRKGRVFATSNGDREISIHADDDLQPKCQLSGHDDAITYIDASSDGRFAASTSQDRTVRVWDLIAEKEIVTLEGHNSSPLCVKFSPHAELLASSASDGIRLWRCRDWECVSIITRNIEYGIDGLAFHPTLPLLAVKTDNSTWAGYYSIDYELLAGVSIGSQSRRYVNAKVMLLGDTGVGKSGLGLVLSGQRYRPTDSTQGRRVWTFDSAEVAVPGVGQQTREVMLWDLAGQPGYRLVHQLHLNEVAVALLVIDSRSETDPFAGVKHWMRALTQARRLEDTTVPLRAYLVAARADRGGVAVSAERIQAMISDLRLDGFFETSAKEGWRITELADVIRDSIAWDELPMVSSSVLFDSIKQFLLDEKQAGRVLCTVDDLFRSFLQTQPDGSGQADLRASFETCIGRVESRDLIRRLRFGGLVLLQPELLDTYASAMVLAAKDEPDGLGFIREADVLAGRFRLSDDERISDSDQEKLLLIATVEELLRHEIALRETTDLGVDLVFPSQFTRERPDAPDLPGRKAVFAFDGPLQSIYASMAVRLAHSSLFRRQTMWQNAASYMATVGGSCGIHLRELEEGRGELILFYDDQAGLTVRSQFETYVAGHLEQRALPGTVVRHPILSCPGCHYVLPDNLVQGKLARGKTTITCPMCDEWVIQLRDEEPSAQAEAAVSAMNRSADERRDLSVNSTRLMGKIETRDYDVFLCYSSRDRIQVTAVGEKLKECGILPWLDIWDIPPGSDWQDELQRTIKTVKSAAVFIGPRGTGPWQEMEVKSILQQFVKHKRPIIPVILDGRVGNPRLPAFLSSRHIVDMRKPDPDPFEQLLWGITGERSLIG